MLVTGFVQGAYDGTSEIFDYLEAFSKYKVFEIGSSNND
jgi:hypothetical protein